MSQFLNYFTVFALLSLSFMTKSENRERWHWHDQIFKNYSIEQGLPHGAISTICEDNLGFIWLVTTQGLVRFDGTNFENVPTIVNDIEFSIRDMVVDTQGIIWMSTSQGLIRFNPNSRVFKSFSLFQNQTFAMGTMTIDKNENSSLIWVATDQGVFKFNTETSSSEKFLGEQFLAMPNLRVFSILNAKSNTVWLGTSNGLYYKNSSENTFSPFDLSAFLRTNLRISALLQTSDNSILVATPRNGLLKINSELQITQPTIPHFTQEWIYSLAEISPGLVWLGSYGKGVIQLDIAKKSTKRMRHSRLLDSSIANDEIWQIYRANNGLVWLATNKGLSLYNPKQSALKTLFGDVGRHKGLSDVNINSLAEDKDGNIWIGLRANGVDVINPTTGLIEHIGVDPKKPDNALPGGAVETLTVQPSGNNFIGSNWGIYQYWQSKLQRLNTGERNNNTYTGVLYADNNYLWAGGTDGLWRFDIDKNQLTNEKQINTANNIFTDHRITVIGKAPNNELLIGTWRGLNWIDESGHITYQLPQANQSSIGNNFISSFFYDENNRLWVATEGAGIYVALEKNHPTHFTQIGKKQGLSSNIVRAMQPDKHGRVWVSSTTGIDVIDINKLQVTSLTSQDGALLPPYYRHAAIQTTADEIIFGGSGGLTLIEPGHWQIDNSFSPLVIINSTAGDHEYTNPFLAQGKAHRLLVPASKNRINIEFTTLDFIDSKSIKYRYRLLGLSNQWTITDAEHRVAAYTTLPPGQYQLEIQNSNRLDHWNVKSHILHFQVLPYWYQTIIAKFLFTLLSIVLIILFIRFRTSNLNKRQLILEEQVRLRTLNLERTTKALVEKSEDLEKVSVTDPLTGINNRRFLDLNMPKEIALANRRYQDLAPDSCSIKGADIIFFLIDIDHFKKVNDQYGHQIGDLVLTEFTDRLKKIARESDYLIRWGGEEFLFVVRETSRELAAKLAHRICQQVKQKPFTNNINTELSLTCSIGFVPFPFCCHNPNETSWLDCIDIADKALYTAKNSGRDAWVGATFKQSLSAKRIVIDKCNLPLDLVNLESNLEQLQVNSTWQKTQGF